MYENYWCRTSKTIDMKLIDITKGSEYDLSLFTEEKISALEERIVMREGKKGSIPQEGNQAYS